MEWTDKNKAKTKQTNKISQDATFQLKALVAGNRLLNVDELVNFVSAPCFSNRLLSVDELVNFVSVPCFSNRLLSVDELVNFFSAPCFSNRLLNVDELVNFVREPCFSNRLLSVDKMVNFVSAPRLWWNELVKFERRGPRRCSKCSQSQVMQSEAVWLYPLTRYCKNQKTPGVSLPC